MSELPSERTLKIVDAFDLPETIRFLLRPGEMVKDAEGRRHRLPRYFYEIPSYEEAMAIRLTGNFRLNEFIRVDLREAEPLREYPRYIPCAVRITAFYLQRIRDEIGSTLHISVNGGYRSPSHERNHPASPHMWGTAVDIYRVGTSLLQSEEQINKYGQLAERAADEMTAFPYGQEPGSTDDHLHLDLGYLFLIPREVSEDRMEMPQETPRFAWEERRQKDRRTPS
jgi:hypothetical protein